MFPLAFILSHYLISVITLHRLNHSLSTLNLSVPPHCVLFERANNCTLCVFCFRGAGGTTGTTGRARMSNTAAWMTWCCSARSTRTPSWTTSRSATWMTTSLYPFAHSGCLTARREAALSLPCYSQNSRMVIHSVTVAVSNSCCREVMRSFWGSTHVQGAKGLSVQPSTLTSNSCSIHNTTESLMSCVTAVQNVAWEIRERTTKKFTLLFKSELLFFLFYCGGDFKWELSFSYSTSHKWEV